MPITLTRRFHAVGQGLFCSEHINIDNDNVFNVVYDCGCSNNATEMNMLDNETETLPNVVDVLFISHFHDDHIRNIGKLICNRKVKKVVIPYLSPYQLLASFVFEDTVMHRPAVSRFRNMLFQAVLGQRRGYVFRPEVENMLPDNMEGVEGFSVEELNKFRQIKYEEIPVSSSSGTKTTFQYTSSFLNILYFPFNYERIETTAFVNEFQEKYPDLFSAIMGLNFSSIYHQIADENTRRNIRKLYKSHFGDVNETSMTVLSVPEIHSGRWNKPDNDCEKETCPLMDKFCCTALCLMNNRPYCLYTGDYAQDISAMKDYYSEYWDKIGIIQVPHHGGKNENPKALYDRNGNGFICIISYGKGNHYGHPHPFAVQAMVQNGCCLQPVYAESKKFVLSIHK